MARGADGERLAYFCMTIIGIGYLFPISAIWAAFDYWKVLFPGTNVEFTVTANYQLVSMATVGVLSVSQSMSLGPRITGGFLGQFGCLALILCFRWLTVESTVLYSLLMALTALVAVSTGYLDSALLSLCSQYSPRMQEWLQLGIGFGTLVSVLYRDATKLFLAGNIEDATTIYFSVALATVILCISCYKLLMSLPVSRHLTEDAGEKDLALLGGSDGAEAVSSPVAFAALSASPLPRDGLRRHVSPDGAGDAEDAEATKALDADASFSTVWPLVWRNQVVICFNLFMTTFCYPGLITSIPCRQWTSLRAESWFQTLLLTSFTFADILARFVTHIRMGIDWSNIELTLYVRGAVVPLVLFCCMSELATDMLAFAVVAAFGFLNGYCVSLSLITVNDIPYLSTEQKKTCGRISACSVNSGLCFGSVFAGAVAKAFGFSA